MTVVVKPGLFFFVLRLTDPGKKVAYKFQNFSVDKLETIERSICECDKLLVKKLSGMQMDKQYKDYPANNCIDDTPNEELYLTPYCCAHKSGRYQTWFIKIEKAMKTG